MIIGSMMITIERLAGIAIGIMPITIATGTAFTEIMIGIMTGMTINCRDENARDPVFTISCPVKKSYAAMLAASHFKPCTT